MCKQSTMNSEEQAEQLRLKEEELNELRRQMAKLCPALAEQPSAEATDSESTIEGSEPTQNRSRRFKLSRMPTETIRDALSHLDRFSIDAAQIVCPRFRFPVEEMLTGVCLRQLESVEMYPDSMETSSIGTRKCVFCPKKACRSHASSNRGFHGDIEKDNQEAVTASGYVIRYGFTRKSDVSGGGTEQEQSKRTVTFQRLEDASEYLLGLIRSATFKELTLRSLTLRDEFFVALISVAPTIFVKALTLRECDVSNVDAGILQHALLQFPIVESLTVGHQVATPHISDAFLEAAHATDTGILRFMFQPTEKKVTLHLPHVSLSSTFCSQLFQLALDNPAENRLELNIRNFGAHEQEGIEAYDIGNGITGGRYRADAPFGMRLTLLINSADEDHSLIFRRNAIDSWDNEWGAY
ncbi:hypothetical protein AAVH_30160 [Aphelenchoides avenae]|nr:hypothetical protein AAVH_30160 [Aphelenchus avenae]